MNLNQYQKLAHTTADYKTDVKVAVVYSGDYKMKERQVPVYPFLKGHTEAGESAEKVLKARFRKKTPKLTASDMAHELGDKLWYVAEGATVLGYTLDDIAKLNLKKLHSRKVRGVIHGSGDNR